MDKKELLAMILEYAMYCQKIVKAQITFKANPTTENETAYFDLLSEDDDKWQKLVNYVYDDEPIDF